MPLGLAASFAAWLLEKLAPMIVVVRRRFRRPRLAVMPAPDQVSPRIWQSVLDADYDLRKAFGLWGRPDVSGEWILATKALVDGPVADPGNVDEAGLSRLMRYYGWSYADVMDTPYPILRQCGKDMDKLTAEESLQSVANRHGQTDYIDYLKSEIGVQRGYGSLAEYFAGIC